MTVALNVQYRHFIQLGSKSLPGCFLLHAAGQSHRRTAGGRRRIYEIESLVAEHLRFLRLQADFGPTITLRDLRGKNSVLNGSLRAASPRPDDSISNSRLLSEAQERLGTVVLHWDAPEARELCHSRRPPPAVR